MIWFGGTWAKVSGRFSPFFPPAGNCHTCECVAECLGPRLNASGSLLSLDPKVNPFILPRQPRIPLTDGEPPWFQRTRRGGWATATWSRRRCRTSSPRRSTRSWPSPTPGAPATSRPRAVRGFFFSESLSCFLGIGLCSSTPGLQKTLNLVALQTSTGITFKSKNATAALGPNPPFPLPFGPQTYLPDTSVRSIMVRRKIFDAAWHVFSPATFPPYHYAFSISFACKHPASNRRSTTNRHFCKPNKIDLISKLCQCQPPSGIRGQVAIYLEHNSTSGVWSPLRLSCEKSDEDESFTILTLGSARPRWPSTPPLTTAITCSPTITWGGAFSRGRRGCWVPHATTRTGRSARRSCMRRTRSTPRSSRS